MMAGKPTNRLTESKLTFFEESRQIVGYVFEELLQSQTDVLGKGRFGCTYKAKLPGKRAVAVKRLKGDPLSEDVFAARIGDFGRFRHENLLPLEAFACHHDERLVLYEYMDLGSLESLLHGRRGVDKVPLSWEKRSQIALGIAQGISFLHTLGSNVVHGNIRSSNVFLTDDFIARVSEYGMTQLIPPDFKLSTPIDGYQAPEITNATLEVSQKSDVYSYGIVVLELVTGKVPRNVRAKDKGTDLAKWVRTMFREKPDIELFDNELHKAYKDGSREQMVELLQLAICCTFLYPDKRPSMAVVTKRIRSICNVSV